LVYFWHVVIDMTLGEIEASAVLGPSQHRDGCIINKESMSNWMMQTWVFEAY